MMRGFIIRQMKCDDVGIFKHMLQGGIFESGFFCECFVLPDIKSQDIHFKRASHANHVLSNIADADNAQSFSLEIKSSQIVQSEISSSRFFPGKMDFSRQG